VPLKIVQFLALTLTALALVPSGAHLFALPNKINLVAEQYFIVQNIYRGWSLFGVALIGALIANLALALLLRGRGAPFVLALFAFLCIALTLIVFIGVWLFFERTVAGKAFQAVALHRRAAALMGINLSRVTALSFGAGGVVAGLGGLLVAPNVSAHYLMGVPLAIQGFTALVIGGVGRVEGALLGGMVLAFAEQFTVRYAPIPSGYAQGVPLLLLMVFLLVRPTGLLKAKT